MKKQSVAKCEKKKTDGQRNPSSETQPHCQSLYCYVKEVFPRTAQKQLGDWLLAAEGKSVEPEPLLFLAVICGAYFRMHDPERIVKETLNYLYGWLTWGNVQHRMNPSIAELLVDALAPGIRSEMEKTGRLPDLPGGRQARGKNLSMDVRGAWAAALVIQNHLGAGLKKSDDADQWTMELTGILLGRKADPALAREYNRCRAKIPKSVIAGLAAVLIKEYENALKHDGATAGDPAPSPKNSRRYDEWKSRHKTLAKESAKSGWEGLCSNVINRVPSSFWKSFWKIPPTPISRKKTG